MKYLIILTLLATNIIPAFSQNLKCSKEGTVFVYVNGQDNELKNVTHTLDRIQFSIENTYASKIFDLKNVTFNFSYNRTLGKNIKGDAIADFLESAALLLAARPGVTLEEAWLSVYRAFMTSWDPTDPLDRYLYNKTDAMYLLNNDETLQKLYNATVGDLDFLKVKTEEYLYQGKKVIYISHSQGNLFVNTLHEQMAQENLLINDKPFMDYAGILGDLQIATPAASIVINNKSRVTNSMDAILRVPGALGQNFLLSLPYIDPRTDLADQTNNHSMLDTYLGGKIGIPIRGNLPELRDMVFNELEKVAQSLDSNCGEEFTPPIEYSANFGPLSTTPVEIDATDTIKALELRNNSSFSQIEWNLGSNIRNSTEKKITQSFNSGLSYPSTAKIFFENGKSTEVKFDVDLTSYTGGAIPLTDLQLLPNEFINTTAMDLGWNHYYLFTTLHRLITLNPDSGQMISEKVIPENVIWMSTNKSGNIVLIYLDVDGKLKFALKNPINRANSLDVALNGDINMFSDPAFDKKNNILYYSLSVNGGGYVLDPADGIFKIINTLVAVNADTGAELARADYLSGSIHEEVFRSNFAPTFVNSNGWLLRMGAYAYNSMSGGEPVFKAFSAAWNPQTLMIDIVYYPDYIDPAHGLVAIDNRKNLAYSFMRITDFNGPTRFTAIDSKTRGIVYSRSPDAVPSLISPQITSKGHMIGLVQSSCTTFCSYSIYRLMRSDDIIESY